MRAAVSCFSPEDVAVVAEVELHVCAALRHLARASSEELGPPLHSPGASRGCVEFGAVGPPIRAEESGEEPGPPSPSWEDLSESVNEASVEQLPANGGHRSGGGVRGGAGSRGGKRAESADASGVREGTETLLAPAFAKALERVVLVAWTFFVHSQLVCALLQGDLVCGVAWALRLVGIGEPWNLRRIHDLLVTALEVLVEHPHGPTGGGAAEAPHSPHALRFLRDSCAVYLRLPVIPRFEARLRRGLSGLLDVGLLPKPGQVGAGEAADAGSPGLDAVLAALLPPEDGPPTVEGVLYGPDESKKSLEAARAEDGLHLRFRRALLEAAAAHSEGLCTLGVRQRLLTGVEALALLGRRGSGRPSPEEVLSAVPQRVLGLADLEESDDGFRPGARRRVIGPEDVLLDVWADLREFEAISRLVNRDSCGLCCSTLGRAVA